MNINNFYFRTVIAASVVLSVSACIDLRKSNKQTVIVETPMVNGAECEMIDNIGTKWYIYDTPEVINITNGQGPITLKCIRDGYKKTIVQIRERYPHEMPLKEYQYMIKSALSVVNDITVDAGKRYPSVLVVLMEPLKFSDEQEKIDWLAAKQSYEKMYQEPDRSDRILELEMVEKTVKRQLLERQVREEIEYEKEIKGEEFIANNRKIQQHKDNISKHSENRKSVRRKILDHFRKKLGFPAAKEKQVVNNNKESKKDFSKKTINNNTSIDKAKKNIELLREVLKSSKKKEIKEKDNGSIAKKAIDKEKANSLSTITEEDSPPISILPNTKFLTK